VGKFAFPGVIASRCTGDHLGGLCSELMESCRGYNGALDAGGRLEQLLEASAEPSAERRRSLLLNNELGENAIEEAHGIDGLGARELGQEDVPDGVAQLSVVQGPVVAGLPHAILGLTLVTVLYG
jgi:hypothetical protein